MLEKHPNRKKDKYNPYTLTITEGHYYLSFKDGSHSPRAGQTEAMANLWEWIFELSGIWNIF